MGAATSYCCDASEGVSKLTPRQRLLALFGFHAPHLLKDVDVTLSKYDGKEEEVLQYYAALLGPEPDAKTAARLYSTHLSHEDITLRRLVYKIIATYEPGRITEIESVVHEYKGNKAQLLHALKRRYLRGKEDQPHQESPFMSLELHDIIPFPMVAIPNTPPTKPLHEEWSAIAAKHNSKLSNKDACLNNAPSLFKHSFASGQKPPTSVVNEKEDDMAIFDTKLQELRENDAARLKSYES